MPDILNLQANERVDLSDFSYAVGTSQLAFQRALGANFLNNASNAQQMWVLGGFALANPTGNQLQVSIGTGLLAWRQGAQVNYGVMASEGAASQTLDLTSYAAATYGVFIRFNYQQGSYSSRVFWSPAGAGAEFAQSTPTRQLASWELRVEIASPGSEYLQIGTVVTPGMAITDMRPLYFEGRVDQVYANTWGSGNDRNVNRSLYGVKDMQTFTAAMRQCIEDIKGPGLRRWWAADVGGMNIGFVASPVEKRLAVGDANYYMQWDSATPYMIWNTTDLARSEYSRTASAFRWLRNGAYIARLSSTGLAVGTANNANALDVGGNVAVGTYAGTALTGTNTLAVSGRIGAGIATPLNTLDVSGGMVVGTYAGANSVLSGYLAVSGRIGVGTASPLNALDVTGSLALGSYAGSQIITGNGNMILSGYLGVGYSSVTGAGLAVSGKLGVGTSAPGSGTNTDYYLDVQNTNLTKYHDLRVYNLAAGQGAGLTLQAGASAGYTFHVDYVSASNSNFTVADQVNNLAFISYMQSTMLSRLGGGSSYITVNSSGSPATTLNVVGDINATGGFKQLIMGFTSLSSPAAGTYTVYLPGTTTAVKFVAPTNGSVTGISAYVITTAGVSLSIALVRSVTTPAGVTLYTNNSPPSLLDARATFTKDATLFVAGEELSLQFTLGGTVSGTFTAQVYLQIEC